MTLSFLERAKECENHVAKQLLTIMHEKQTMLSLSLDVEDKHQFLKTAEQLGEKICLLKTHIDIVKGVDKAFLNDLSLLAQEKSFLIFEDRKFADIGNTVKKQYSSGVFEIAEWAHIVNAHPLPGCSIVEGLKSVGLPKGRALLLLAQMSSRNNLIDDRYIEETINMAKEHREFVIGFIAQQRLLKDPSMLHLTPGVKLQEKTDKLGQQYQTPETKIKMGSDIIIVGRGITESVNPLATAETYRQQAWDTYQEIIDK